VLDSDHVSSNYVISTSFRVFTCDEACLSSEMDEKLVELVRECDELYDISHKKYSDSIWKEKFGGQIGED